MSEPKTPEKIKSPQSPGLGKTPQIPQSPAEVSANAAKLALRSAADHQNTKTGKHLTQFSENIKNRLASDEYPTERPDETHDRLNIIKSIKLDERPNPETEVVNPVWVMVNKLFYDETQVVINMDNVDKNREIEIKLQTKNDNESAIVITKIRELLPERKAMSTNKLNSVMNVKPEEIQMKKSSIRANRSSPIYDLGQTSSTLEEHQELGLTSGIPVPDKIASLDWDNLTVEVRNVSFHYKKSKKSDDVLKKVNISIPKSAIYGLLGPSGCGKTTLLKLVLGRIKPKSGTVKIDGKKPGKHNGYVPGIGVGFMPQELALYEEFSIKEALEYFGTIYGMNKEQIVRRIKFLVDFLDLPEPERRIQTLSGGQKRRVSLSVALVHSPPLLILDEPTVGTDPLLREKIWEHLSVLSKSEKITILITTHYIEEARRADIASLMRKGNLLVEHSPDYLLNYFKAQNLEEVFLNICLYDPNNASYPMPDNYIDSRPIIVNDFIAGDKQSQHSSVDGINTTSSRKNLIENNNKEPNTQIQKSSRTQKLIALTHKNYIRVIRNKPLLAFQLILPTICIILFCLCIGIKPYHLKIALFNQEFETLAKDSLSITLSILFLQQVDNNTILFKNYDSKESALNSVKDSETFGAIIFDKMFTPALINRISARDFLVNNTDIEKSTIQFYGDFTDIIISEAITKAILEAQMKFQRQLITDFLATDNSSKPINPRSIDPLVHFNNPPVYGSLEPNFRDFMAPGIILAVTYILAVGLTALSLVVERKEGLLERTLVSGVKIHDIIIGQIIVQLVILILQTLSVLIFTFLIFKIQNNGSIFLIIIMILLQGITGMSFGLVISAICRDEQSAIMLSLGSFYPYLILSGIIWPLEGMPHSLRQFSYFLPQTLPILSLRNIMLKGWNILYTFVWLGYVSTISWILIFLLTASIIGSIKK